MLNSNLTILQEYSNYNQVFGWAFNYSRDEIPNET